MTGAVVNPWLAGLAALFILLLTGCQTTTWPEGQQPAKPAASGASAEAHAEAARAFQQQALEAGVGDAGGLWLSAADSWAQAGRPDEARFALRRVDRGTLSPAEQSRLYLVLADLAMVSGRTDEAEILLDKARSRLPSSSRGRYEALYAQLLDMLASPATQEIALAAQISDSMAQYDPSKSVEIMVVLEPVSSGELAIRALNPRAARQLTGWLDLALVVRRNLVKPENVTAAVADWKARHPYHALTEGQALDTWLRYRQRFTPPARVAVLLPGSGRLQAAGEAIRDGLVSAYVENPGNAELLFFPTGDDPQSAIAAYFSALDAGVDQVVGPLRKESIETMLALPGLRTPMLALNDLPQGFLPQPGLEKQIRGISLSQEQEVAAATQHAIDSGFQRALVLAPESEWGERMALAFEAEFLQEDREIVASMRYLESENDHSAMLQRALKIDESKLRKRQLERTLQTQIEFEPIRRDDVDVIFMASNTAQARQIRPQLRFHDAGGIPVYAPGRVFSGLPDRAGNQDLNGIRFPITPWQLEHNSRESLPELSSIRGGSLAPLYALGRDAWNILRWQGLMTVDPEFWFTGDSGNYRTLGRNTLTREPAMAVFRGGLPQRLEDTETLVIAVEDGED
jgi:outer membrane PBP1 activator LpoA protein